MKKIVVSISTIVFALGLCACGSSESTAENSTKASKEKSATEKSVVEESTIEKSTAEGSVVEEDSTETTIEEIFSYDGDEVGNGNFYVVTASGSSESGETPILYTAKNNIDQIGVEGWEMDGSLLSYIYVDGILNTTMQLADTQSSLMLDEANYESGTHKVECVQYEGNDDTGEIVFYRSVDLDIEIQ